MSLPTSHPSVLHRMLKIEPGHAPTHLYSVNGCTGFEALTAAVVIAFFCGVLLCSVIPPVGAILIALAAGFAVCFVMPFDACERKARARARQAALAAKPTEA